VNRKQAEVAFSAARELNALEPRVRQFILQQISRGRIQVTIVVTKPSQSQSLLEIDLALARAVEDSFVVLSRELGREIVAGAGEFVRIPGIFRGAEMSIDAEEAWLAIEPALIEAMAIFQQSREQEGDALLIDMQIRLGDLQKQLEVIREASPGRSLKQADLLQKRLTELQCPIDPADERVLKEIALFADRCDISEEVTRLICHFEKFQQYLTAAESPGRALDFLCQEIHREFNTIGSKAYDSVIAHAVVTAKTELEKIREQVQNLE
jgi:uncharacterized protein (TIGR00255 family)